MEGLKTMGWPFEAKFYHCRVILSPPDKPEMHVNIPDIKACDIESAKKKAELLARRMFDLKAYRTCPARVDAYFTGKEKEEKKDE